MYRIVEYIYIHTIYMVRGLSRAYLEPTVWYHDVYIPCEWKACHTYTYIYTYIYLHIYMFAHACMCTTYIYIYIYLTMLYKYMIPWIWRVCKIGHQISILRVLSFMFHQSCCFTAATSWSCMDFLCVKIEGPWWPVGTADFEDFEVMKFSHCNTTSMLVTTSNQTLNFARFSHLQKDNHLYWIWLVIACWLDWGFRPWTWQDYWVYWIISFPIKVWYFHFWTPNYTDAENIRKSWSISFWYPTFQHWQMAWNLGPNRGWNVWTSSWCWLRRRGLGGSTGLLGVSWVKIQRPCDFERCFVLVNEQSWGSLYQLPLIRISKML